MRKAISLFSYFFFSQLVVATCLASSNYTLNQLSGTWENLDTYVTLGTCASAPSSAALYTCSPAQLGQIEKSNFVGSGFTSATDSVLKIADSLRKTEVSIDDVSDLFSKYNYTEFQVNTRLNYVAPHFSMGIVPFQSQGKFQIHNPNLPFASFTFREDLGAFLGTGIELDLGEMVLSMGAVTTYIKRREILAEANLVEFASKPANQILKDQHLNGLFFDLGASVEFFKYLTLSALMKDLGGFHSERDFSNYLFITEDHNPRYFLSASISPPFWIGHFQFGLEFIGFTDDVNTVRDQWFATVSYFVGPLRVLSGFRTDLVRTGLGMRFSGFDLSIAQEWLNKLEDGINVQPLFTVELSKGL